MPIESRIKRWYCEAQRKGIHLESILIHPDDYWRNRSSLRFLPIRVIGSELRPSRSALDTQAEK